MDQIRFISDMDLLETIWEDSKTIWEMWDNKMAF